MDVLGLDEGKVKKAAALFVQGCPVNGICFATGLEPEELDALVDHKRFKDQLALLQYEENQKQQLVDKGWDGVEKLALKSVIDHLQGDPDPDFALRAAAMANKAERKISKGNKTLEPGAGNGNTVVIQMSKRFVTNYVTNQMVQVADRTDETLPPKRQFNILSPGKVEKMLDILPKKEDQGAEFESALAKLMA